MWSVICPCEGVRETGIGTEEFWDVSCASWETSAGLISRCQSVQGHVLDLLVLLQRRPYGEKAIRSIRFLRMSNEFGGIGRVEVELLQLPVGGNDNVAARHDGRCSKEMSKSCFGRGLVDQGLPKCSTKGCVRRV